MNATRAIEAVAATGIPHRVVTYGQVETIEEAAALRGVPIISIVKTLVVRRGEDNYVLVLVGGDRAMDWRKLRTLLGVKRISLPDRDELVAATRYERGTVTPFGATRLWPVYADEHVARLLEASVGGGAHGVAIHLAGEMLVSHFGAVVADLSKGPKG